MAVPVKYRRSGEPVIASFDWETLATGTGYKRYYLFSTTDSASTKYGMIPNATLKSEPISDDGNIPEDALLAKYEDIDFDLLFTKPIQMKGVIYSNFYIEMATVSSFYVITKFYHVDGADVETLITSVQTPNKTGNTRFSVQTPEMQQNFKVGDKLRVTVELWAVASTAGTRAYKVFHDPLNTTANTDFFVDMPFRIQQ